jgi:hypothetical protein
MERLLATAVKLNVVLRTNRDGGIVVDDWIVTGVILDVVQGFEQAFHQHVLVLVGWNVIRVILDVVQDFEQAFHRRVQVLVAWIGVVAILDVVQGFELTFHQHVLVVDDVERLIVQNQIEFEVDEPKVHHLIVQRWWRWRLEERDDGPPPFLGR